jgi:hypothetical protein
MIFSWKSWRRRPTARGFTTRRTRGRTSRCTLSLEALEDRTVPAGNTPATAVPLTLLADQAAASGSLSQDPTYYALNVTEAGRLLAQVHAPGQHARLSLLSADGTLLVQSDGQSAANPDDLIDLHVPAGPSGTTYYLEVQALESSTGTYSLVANYSATTAPDDTLDGGRDPYGITTGDFNGDGKTDIAVAGFFTNSVSVYLGAGDGTFAAGQVISIGQGFTPNAGQAATNPFAIVAGDFTGRGKLDLAVANFNGTLSILPGNGDGTFGPEAEYVVGDSCAAVTTGDFNGDGSLDIAVADHGGNAVDVFLNQGDGSFTAPLRFSVGTNPYGIVAGDFNGDGHVDLATANNGSDDVSVLLGNGDGTFQSPTTVAAGTGPHALVAADFNHDGRLDLAVANYASSDVSLLLGNGDGTFAPQTRLATGSGPVAIAAADFTGHGGVDLVTANAKDATISVFLGQGNGAFDPQQQESVQERPSGLAVADFNGDGAADLAISHLTVDFVDVQLGNGDGTFRTGPRSSPGAAPDFAIAVDFNHDGLLDLATVDVGEQAVTVLLGNGDGTFRFGGQYATGGNSWGIAAADLTGNGLLDLITANIGSDTVSVLLANPDGTFGAPTVYATGAAPTGVAVADLDHDGHLDIISANSGTDTITVLYGDGTGKFGRRVDYKVGLGPETVVAGDFNGDGFPDLAVANSVTSDVSVLINNGDGTFAPEKRLTSGGAPITIVAADLTGNGKLDLVTANRSDNTVTVFLGDGKGGFGSAIAAPTGVGPYEVRVGDFNGDGVPDLATFNVFDDTMTVLLGRGDGTFQPSAELATGETLGGQVGDFNGDGKTDLVGIDKEQSDVAFLPGNGDGTFGTPLRTPVSVGPSALAGADFNGDGQQDIVTANPTSGTVAVALGNGDGTFQTPTVIALGGEPVAVTTGDFNHDGRPDIAVANYLTNSVDILLGLGDGTFRPSFSVSVGQHPTALVGGDFNGDGITDLAVANEGCNSVSILLGGGDGTFTATQRIALPEGPVALATGDFDGDGTTELVVTGVSGDLFVLKGAGNGTFRLVRTVALGTTISAVVTGDFNGDGHLDLAVTERTRNAVAVLLGNGDDTFQAPVPYTVGMAPVALVAGDFNGDGHLDLATANDTSDDVTILTGQGDGTFLTQAVPFPVGSFPVGLLAGDLNNDGHLDLATVNALGAVVSVGLGLGDGTFVDVADGAHPLHSTPLVADLNGDGVPDVAILAGNGQILVRFGNPTAAGTFAPPVVLNPDPAASARDLTMVTVNGRQELAALDAYDSVISLYAFAGGSAFIRRRAAFLPDPEDIPARIAAGDLNGDGRKDLVVTSYDTDGGHVFVYLQQPDGTFGPATYQMDNVGISPTDLALVDLGGGNGPDIVVTDQHTGEILVLENASVAPFQTQLVFRAGTGLSGVVQEDALEMESPDAPIALAAGMFARDAAPGLVVLNGGSHSFDLLEGDGLGGLFNPTTSLTWRAGSDPRAVVTGDFNGDGIPDLAVLDRASDQVLVYLGDGQGGFVPLGGTGPDGLPRGCNAGNAPDSLAAFDVNGDGHPDLIVGNTNGDILVLLGNGDGTFQPYQRTDRHVALAVMNANSGNPPEFALADQSRDLVTLVSSQPGPSFDQGRQDGVLSPNAVKLADLNGDGIPDLIVANGGGNDILVYPGLADGMFGPARNFFAGTDPVSVTVADLNGDGLPDLVVANQGSNDVSVLYGQGQGADWTLTEGPRLKAGLGPTSTTVADVYGNGIPDILVANGQSNNAYLLPGVGGGFFDDKHPTVFQTGIDPQQIFVGRFDSTSGLGLVTVDAGSNDLTYFPGFGAGRTVATGGLTPAAAVAGDFLQDGLTDLIVIHSGDDRVTLFLAGTEGPQIAAGLSPVGLGNLSDLALGALQGNSVEFYVTSEGQDTVTGLTFLLDVSPAARPPEEVLLQAPVSQQVTVYSETADQPQGAVAAVFFQLRTDAAVSADGQTIEALPGTAFVSEVATSPNSGNRDPVGAADEVGTAGTILILVNPEPADAPVELNAFLVGVADTPAGLFLSRLADDPAQPLDTALPPPQPFDFSDVPTAVPAPSAVPELAPALPEAKGREVAPAPVPGREEPARPDALVLPEAEAVLDTALDVNSGGSLTGGMRWLALLLTQLLVGPRNHAKPPRVKEMDLERERP